MDAHSIERLDFARIRDLLAGYALSGLGRGLAAHVQPSTRSTLVRRWLAQVEEMRTLIEQRGMPPFGGITDVREPLARTAPPLRVTVEEVADIGATLLGTHELCRYFAALPEAFPELRHLAERIGDFLSIAQRIRRVIDERARVRDDASPKLQAIRRNIEIARGQIEATIEKLLRDAGVRRFLQYPNHTFHNDRVVFPLRSEYRGRIPGIVHRTSDSGATLYVEPANVVELNNHISNLRSEEQEEINRLLWDLAHEIHLNETGIRQTLETLAVVDLIVAKVRFARDYDMRCPAVTDAFALNVRGARHPLLLEMARARQKAGEAAFKVVPIDYRLGHDFSLLVVTGPNTGGKTVSLKTIGLLSLMVQAGLPVPVDPGAEFGVFAHVLIDVGDEQSMQQSLSTFSAHMTRLLAMLRHATPRTLLLIDELGAGTDPDEGAAIGLALMDELLRTQCRAVVTTHLGVLKSFALTRAAAENACVDFDHETLMPTYHLRIGEPGHSNAIEVAARLGLPKRLVAAARRNVSRKARALHAALEGTREVKREAEHARRAADEAKTAAGRAQDEALAARREYEQRQAAFEQWVRRVVHLQPGDAVRVREFDRDGKIVRLRLDQQRAEVDVGAFSVEVPLGDVLPPQTPAPPPKPPRPLVPRTEAPPKPRRARSAAAGDGQPPRQPRRDRQPAARPSEPRPMPVLASLTAAQAEKLQPLDTVYVKRFHREGQVVRLKPGKQLAIISVGALEVEVPFDGLALPPSPRATRHVPAARQGEPPEPPPPTSAASSDAASAPPPAPSA